jgi:hypothetical protein
MHMCCSSHPTGLRLADLVAQTALEIFRSSGPDTEQRLAMLTVPVQEYDIADAGRVWAGCGMNRLDGLCCDR